jgi:hypothetical protein
MIVHGINCFSRTLPSYCKMLTSKGPRCIFWQHSDFGQIDVTRNFINFL